LESNDVNNVLRFDLTWRLYWVSTGVQVQAVDGGLSIHPHPPLVISRPRRGREFFHRSGWAGRVSGLNRLTDK